MKTMCYGWMWVIAMVCSGACSADGRLATPAAAQSGGEASAESSDEARAEPGSDSPSSGGPRAGARVAEADEPPLVTGSVERMPEGYVTDVTLAGQRVSIPYTQLGAMVSRPGTASLLLTATPGKGGERVGPLRYPSLSMAWNVPTAEVSSLSGLSGQTFELERVPLGRVVLRVDGKEYMATEIELRIDKADADQIRGSFTGTFGEFHPRRSLEPMGELAGKGTFRAYPGKWIELARNPAGGE